MRPLVDHLRDAGSKEKKDILGANPFKRFGFDGMNARLGWVNPPTWSCVKQALFECNKYIKNKKEFIFIGMGGSINGVKTLVTAQRCGYIHYVDSLDPRALIDVVKKIKRLRYVMIICITKSGSTKETHLIAHTVRTIFKKKVKEHFLWLVDKGSHKKLGALGWKGFSWFPIQADGRTDVGGRFTSPHTLVFLLPLYLMFKKDLTKVKRIYEAYLSGRQRIVAAALGNARSYKNKKHAYFAVQVESSLAHAARTWITQLFQESLGSKKNGLNVKTLIVDRKCTDVQFSTLTLTHTQGNQIVRMMLLMHYLQHFVAYWSGFRSINFVNQPSVEQYKQKMKVLTFADMKSIDEIDAKGLITEIQKKIKRNQRFIELILYFHPTPKEVHYLEASLKRHFPQRKVFVFVGSDWNHHSYQAAFKDAASVYCLLTRKKYVMAHPFFKAKRLKENVATLELISYATYLTIKRKGLLRAISK